MKFGHNTKDTTFHVQGKSELVQLYLMLIAIMFEAYVTIIFHLSWASWACVAAGSSQTRD